MYLIFQRFCARNGLSIRPTFLQVSGPGPSFVCTLAVAIFLCVSPVRAVQTFTNATAAAGIVYPLPDTLPTLENGSIAQTGGAAAGDFDNDGWPDLFITRHWDSPLLYRNNQDGTFSDVTSSAFLAGLLGANLSGASWGDIDNDGDLDLYASSVFNSQGNQLYINDGLGHFDDQATQRGAQYGGSNVASMSSSMGDYDNDGYLDMYVTEWRLTNSPSPPQARLMRNLGAAQPGYFEDVTAASGASMGPLTGQSIYQSVSFTPRFADLDRDGHTDLIVASDYGTTRMFWNNGNGTFTDGTAAFSGTFGKSDMGLAIGDYDSDGKVDFFTTDICYPDICNTGLAGNRLFRNFGNRTFLEASDFTGVRDTGWGWGTQMFDYDNDRDLDIIATNGYYSTPVEWGFETDQVRLFRNNGQGPILTNFTNVATSLGMTDTSQGRGLLTFDYDRDGDLDVFIVNNFQAPILYRNDGGNLNGNWLQIETVGTISNADGVGAFITVTPDLAFPNKKLVHEITLSSSFLSQSEPIAHFGLGTSTDPIDLLRIEWPASGIVQEFYNVAINQRLTITEPRPGDFDGDGDIDGRDFLAWQRSPSIGDLADWQGYYEVSSIVASVAVPEPNPIVCFCLSSLWLVSSSRVQHRLNVAQ
jgi:hypothetical protein